MATLPPLEFDISGFEQYKAPARSGVRAAADAEQLRRVVEASRARAAAAQSAASAAAPGLSIPTAENPAPLATAAAANRPSFGSRVLNAARSPIVKRLGAAGVLASAADLGVRAGDVLTPDGLAVGMADAVGQLGKALGIDSLAQYAGGAEQVARAATIPDPALAAAAPATSGAALSAQQSAAAAAAGRSWRDYSDAEILAATPPINPDPEFDRRQREAMSNQLTAGLAAGGLPPMPRRSARVAVPRQTLAPPQLGTNGSIFANLSTFVNDFGEYAMSEAGASRAAKLDLKQRALDIQENDSEGDFLNQREANDISREAGRAKSVTEIIKAGLEANKDNKKVVQDVTGNPIVVDLKRGTATKIEPTQKPTIETFVAAARKDPRNKGVSDAQLRAYYAKTYGG